MTGYLLQFLDEVRWYAIVGSGGGGGDVDLSTVDLSPTTSQGGAPVVLGILLHHLLIGA